MKTIRFSLLSLMFVVALGADEASTERVGIENDYAEINAAAEKMSQVPLRPAAEFTPRQGMPRLFGKLSQGEPITIAYYGGSITAGPGWRTATQDWFKRTYPDSTIRWHNASLGGSGSLVGAFRADHDLVPARPDAVFIEFSLNDVADTRDRPHEVAGALEGIIRKLLLRHPETDICLTYTLHSAAVDLLNAGKFSASVSIHESIAEHYGIPSIHMGVVAARLAASGELIFTAPARPDDRDSEGRLVFTNDGTHPTAAGHRLNGEAAIRGLEKLRQQTTAAPRTLPSRLATLPWEKARTVAATGHAHFQGAWSTVDPARGPACRRFGRKFYDWFPKLHRTTRPGASLTVRFRGTHIGLKGLEGPDSGMVEIKVDDQPAVKKSIFTVYSNAWVYVGAPLPALPMGDHTITWTLLAEAPAKEQMLAVKKTDSDLRAHPEKYRENSFSVGQIIVLGDLLDADGKPLP